MIFDAYLTRKCTDLFQQSHTVILTPACMVENVLTTRMATFVHASALTEELTAKVLFGIICRVTYFFYDSQTCTVSFVEMNNDFLWLLLSDKKKNKKVKKNL